MRRMRQEERARISRITAETTLAGIRRLTADFEILRNTDDDTLCFDREECEANLMVLDRTVEIISCRIPKKPLTDFMGETLCPCCGAMQHPGNKPVKYCVWCGQAIKFGKDSEI